jgi:hypothetical protein
VESKLRPWRMPGRWTRQRWGPALLTIAEAQKGRAAPTEHITGAVTICHFATKKQQTTPVASFFLPVFFSTATLGFEVRDLRGCRGEVTASGLTHGWRGWREARWWRRVAGRDVSGGDTVSRGQWLVSRCAGSVGGSVSSPLRSHQITARTGRGCQIRR